MADTIQANYEQLQDLAKRFQNLSTRVDQLSQSLKQRMHQLQDGGWDGMGASAFYQEMSSITLPACTRLSSAFQQASRTTTQIERILRQAEEDAASPFRAGPVQSLPLNGVQADSFVSTDASSSAKRRAKILNSSLDREEKRVLLNELPKGELVPIGNASSKYEYNPDSQNLYKDANGRIWKLQPDEMAEYHQPDPNVHPYPNKKFVSLDETGGSSEAIMAPDKTYITTGPQRGTYNFVDPSGISLGLKNHFASALAEIYVQSPSERDQAFGRDIGHLKEDIEPFNRGEYKDVSPESILKQHPELELP